MGDNSPTGQTLTRIADTLDQINTKLDDITTKLDAETPSTCPHGDTGFCMSCVIPLIDNALQQIIRDVGNQVFEATRRG